ncbi:hypothetical protein YC2023_114449 [Brassica napus]
MTSIQDERIILEIEESFLQILDLVNCRQRMLRAISLLWNRQESDHLLHK